MVNSNSTIVAFSASCDPLYTPLVIPHDEEDTAAAAVDYKNNLAVRSKTGRWRSAAFIIGVEIAERMAYYGIQCNLIIFLTGELGQSTATAAANVNAWAGVATSLPIFGAVIADSYLGKYRTIISAALLNILGLGLLTLSAMLPSLDCPAHGRSIKSVPGCLSHLRTMMFFGALYLVAIGQGGYKPCVQAFGADQFDGSDPEESKAKSSFFNWWYFGLSSGSLLGVGVSSYVQDNFSWSLTFGIPSIVMIIALLVFLLGTFTYRFIKKNEEQTPFLRIGRVFIRAVENRHAKNFVPEDEVETQLIPPRHGSEQFRFLDKALLLPDTSKLPGTITSKSEVEEAKALLRLFPIWATNLVFGIVFAQVSTFFTKQGVTLDRSIGPSFKIPAAALQSFTGIFIIILIPIYDCLLVPFARRFTGKPSGISVLQRIGIGLFISIVSMVVAAIVEKRRLNMALHYRLIDLPNATIPMSIWWLVPQYALFGIADGFTIVGQQEFFYDQVPVELRSVGIALYLSALGVGNFLSSILVFLINKLTSSETASSWLTDNLNRAHLDYFYWLLAVLSAIGTIISTDSSRCDPLCNSLLLPLVADDTVVAAVDYKDNPAVRSKTGRWRSAAFIIGVATAELIVDSGIQGNLINFVTGELGQSLVTAAANVNAWAGVAYLLPVLGAVIADSYLGKYRTVIAASLIYILDFGKKEPNVQKGLSLLTLSAMLTSLDSPIHGRIITSMPKCSPRFRVVIFFGALYLAALGQGGFKPCLHAFGADQFDGDHPAESKAKSSYFNWLFFGLSLGALLGTGVLSYVQDNLSWGLGFGIPCFIMVMALLIFILRTFSYRFIKISDEQTPILRIGRVFARAAKNRHVKGLLPVDEEDTQLIESQPGSGQFRLLVYCLEFDTVHLEFLFRSFGYHTCCGLWFLDKALHVPDTSDVAVAVTSKSEVEEAKALLRLFPIWAISSIFGIIFAQSPTFFTKQAATLDRSLGPNFDIPPASLQAFIAMCILIFIPIYDCLLVPFARNFTGKPSGISVLQRIGTGLFISIVCMVVAAIIEKRRLDIAMHYGLIDLPKATVPMSIWWLLPQYAISGIADAFTIVGLQEFFYDQVPVELRSVGMSVYLTVLGIGSFLSSILVSLVDKLTSGETESSWLSDNLNRAHLDYFYWLLAGISTLGLVLFMHFSKSYIYTNTKVHM
ncbi:hypothetical protein KSS87_020675 [Heliosperma pusillum]|nr:hypothetical protein KSS87_020675 [Heliosperma pusillum]